MTPQPALTRYYEGLLLAVMLAALTIPMGACTQKDKNMPKTSPISVQDRISGKGFLATQAALKVLDHHKLNLAAYKIIVLNEGNPAVVVLPEAPGTAASERPFGVRQGIEVEMSNRELGSLVPKLEQIQPQENIQGRNHLAAQKAATEFLRCFNADLANYRIEVVRDGGHLVVIFTGREVPPGTVGNVVRTPGFEVALNPRDLAIQRSQFVR